MDFSILYRVFWQPQEVFVKFDSKKRLEPFIFFAVFVLLVTAKNIYLGSLEVIFKPPSLLLLILIQVFIGALMIPLVNSAVLLLVDRLLIKSNLSFMNLMSTFILCAMPIYAESTMNGFGYRSLGLGTFVSSLTSSQPFLFGMFATITIGFAWMIYLWSVALNRLYLQSWRNGLIVALLVLIDSMLGGGLWRLISVMMK
jgi:hypothetical protein